VFCEGRNWVTKSILRSCHRVKYIVFRGLRQTRSLGVVLYRPLSTVESMSKLYFQLLASSYHSTRNDKITIGTSHRQRIIQHRILTPRTTIQQNSPRQVTLGPPVRPILPLEALRARLAQLLVGDPWLEAEDEDARLWRCILPGSTSGMLAMRAKSERTGGPRVNNWSSH
jgi:hypothetical protein